MLYVYFDSFRSVTNFFEETLQNSPSLEGLCPVRLYVLNDVTLMEQYNGKEVNIAVVYNSYPSVYKTVYLNGAYIKSTSMNSTLFANMDTAYLGRARALSPGPAGLNASFSEYRIYFGQLSNSDAQSVFLVGQDPSHITLSSSSTMSNVYIVFYATSVVNLDIQFLGGSPGPVNSTLESYGFSTSYLYKMFGSETSFQLIPVDQQCTYSPIFKLNADTSATNNIQVPAMNYTITLLKSSVPAPVFSSNSCPLGNVPCFCGVSEAPYEYMSSAKLLNQSFLVTSVNSTISVFQYYYRTGLCYEAIGSERFATSQGVANSQGDSCFSPNVFFMNMSTGNPLKTHNLTIKLFERYPQGVSWFSINNQNQYVANEWTAPPLVNWYIDSGTLEVLDQVTGSNSGVTISYNTTIVLSCDQCYTTTAVGNLYTISANNAFPSFPYDLKFRLYAIRTGPDGVSGVDKAWYIPVLGAVSNAVPNFYPVSSDPNLIFLIVRDPPGNIK